MSDFTESGDKFLAIMHAVQDDIPEAAWEAILKSFRGCMNAYAVEMGKMGRLLKEADELLDMMQGNGGKEE